jgi:hypothetical protein
VCDLEFVDAESNQKLAELLGTLGIEMQAQTDTNATLRTLVSTLVSAEPLKYTGEEWPLPDGTEHPIR